MADVSNVLNGAHRARPLPQERSKRRRCTEAAEPKRYPRRAEENQEEDNEWYEEDKRGREVHGAPCVLLLECLEHHIGLRGHPNERGVGGHGEVTYS